MQGDGIPLPLSKEEEPRLVLSSKAVLGWDFHSWKLISAFPRDEGWIGICLAKSSVAGLVP